MERIVCYTVNDKKTDEIVCSRADHADRWEMSVNGKAADEKLNALFYVYTDMQIPFAGTYCPEDEHSAYYAMSAIERMFRSPVKFTELEFDERMPGEFGVVF